MKRLFTILLIGILSIGWSKNYTQKWLKERRIQIEKLEAIVAQFSNDFYFVVYFDNNNVQIVPMSSKTVELSKAIKARIEVKTNK